MLRPILLFPLIVLFVAGCKVPEEKAHENNIPPWLEVAQNNQEIRGIAVHVSPEVPGAEKYFSLYSPYEINYIFSNDAINVIFFDSKGNKVEDRWSSLDEIPFNEDDIVPTSEWIKRLEGGERGGSP